MAVTSSDPLNLREFLIKYQSLLTDSEASTIPYYFSSVCSPSAEIEDCCSLEHLSAEDERPSIHFKPDVDLLLPTGIEPLTGIKLKTYNILNQLKNAAPHRPFARTQYNYRLAEPTKKSGINKELKSIYNEIELTLRFYRPARAAYRSFKMENPVFSEEFLCLGSNYLTQLRDKISCICNGKRFIDISNQPDAPLPILETDPGYFFIQDTFYNDMRNVNNYDYSEKVRKWAVTALGEFSKSLKVAKMEETKFIDLNVSLGSPLHYLHHGNCEHLFVITQVEVMTLNNGLDIMSYPYMRAFNCFNRRTCFMCGLRAFSFIVEQSRRQLQDPSYVCRTCFFSFHYINNKKNGQFKAYRLYDSLEDIPADKDGDESSDKSATESIE